MHTANTALAIVYPLVERLGFSERDVALMSSTFGHQTGYLYGYGLTLLLGSTGVWLDVWNAEEAARLIEAERVTYTMGATPFLQDLTYSPAVDQRDLSSLRLFISAGAAIPRKLVQDARKRLRCAISAGWGMSENGLVTCNGLDDPDEKVFGTDGRPLPGMDVAVVGDDGEILPAAREGDLLVRGHSQFVGYWKRPEFTRDGHTPDGWFKTGDRAVLDADGYLAITGRVKDLIIRGGENISVAEVENLLYAHPKVQNVAVVAMPDPRLVERACAFVIPTPGQSITLAEIVAYLAARTRDRARSRRHRPRDARAGAGAGLAHHARRSRTTRLDGGDPPGARGRRRPRPLRGRAGHWHHGRRRRGNLLPRLHANTVPRGVAGGRGHRHRRGRLRALAPRVAARPARADARPLVRVRHRAHGERVALARRPRDQQQHVHAPHRDGRHRDRVRAERRPGRRQRGHLRAVRRVRHAAARAGRVLSLRRVRRRRYARAASRGGAMGWGGKVAIVG